MRESSLSFQLKLLRHQARRLETFKAYGWSALQRAPRFFANSFPKSGTHLLTQVLQTFPRLGPAVNSGFPAIVTFDGRTGEKISEREIMKALHRLKPGDIAYGHLHALPEITNFLQQDSWATFFILRDPRDVVVSHVHYVTEMEPNHAHHQYFVEKLENFDQRLAASIAGFASDENESSDGGLVLPDIRSRFEPLARWLAIEEVLTIRFEEFLTHPRETLMRIVHHATIRGFEMMVNENEGIEILLRNINPQRSPTFREGKAGGWKHAFTPAHKNLFKEIAGDLLIRLGYEKDNDW